MLIRVDAAGIDPGDWHLMTGLPYLVRIMGFGLRKPKARVRGMDVAGRIEAVGKHVTQLQPGDEVFGTCDGSFAEDAWAREHKLAPKPANLSLEQAVAVPSSAFAALHGLREKGRIKAGHKVPHHQRGGGRRHIHRAARQIVRSGSDRRLQPREAGPGAIDRRGTTSSTTPAMTSQTGSSATT